MRQVAWENSLPTRKFYLNDVQLKLCIPNSQAKYTINNLTNQVGLGFASWIEIWVDKSSLVIDVGANFGVVSIYSALKQQCNVVAFEPHFGTYYRFYRNIIANRLQNCIYPFQLALSTSSGFTNKFDISDALLVEH